jgi:Endonuclease/Exonuclease/phosphatase family 2
MPPNAADFADLTDGMFVPNGVDNSVPNRLGQRPFPRQHISIHLTTFNCANNPHPMFPIALPEFPPDLLVLGLQELAPSSIAFLNLAVVENVYLKGLRGVADFASKRYEMRYELVKVVRIGQTALAVWTSLGERLKRVQTAWAGCGLLGLLPNKGAAATRLTFLDGTPRNAIGLTVDRGLEVEVTFVAAHLAAHERHFERRNEDFQSLVQNLVFPDHTGIFKPRTPLFFLGDLNYRLSVLHPSRSISTVNLKTAQQDPIPEETLSLMEALREGIVDFLETGKFHNLFPHDQLPLSPLVLHLSEAPITFSPTYKYESHDPPEYAPTRTPSWTDRILYTPESVETTDYTSITCVTFSDHQAVSLSAVLRPEDFENEDGVMPWEINPAWLQRQVIADQLAYFIGLAEFMGREHLATIALVGIVYTIAQYYIFKHFVG